MESYIIFYVMAMIALSFFFHYEKSDKMDVLSRRNRQVSEMFRENIVKKSLDKAILDKTTITKRVSMEVKLHQAGFNISYPEYMMLNGLTATIMALVFGTVMNNIGLAILFLGLGFFVPYQFVAFLRNKRLKILEQQVGSFMQMSISRYKNTRDFSKALQMTGKEFYGEEPIYTEIQKTTLEIDLGIPVAVALKGMAERTANKYMERFAAYYAVASEVGTDELRSELMNQAYQQFEEDRQMKRELKKEIAGPLQEAYIMIGAVPAFAVYQALTNPDYIRFMTQSSIGKIGTTAIVAVLILVAWFANAKLGAPLD